MNRRRFLKVTGLGLSASTVAGAGLLAAIQPRRRLYVAGDPQLPERTKTKKRVVVIGGGLAGLAAATELSARNFAVTLLERAPELGGKLGGWTVNALGEEFPVEHGFHGFFSQYYNLSELLASAGATSDLVESPGYPVLFGDRPPETFGQTSKIFPVNLLEVVRQSKSLHLMDFRRDGAGLYDLMKWDGERTFERFDSIDFATFCREGRINRAIVETVFEPFGKTTLNRVDRLSAAEAIRFFHFYFMGNPEGLAFRFTRRDSMTAIIRPLARRFESLGGNLRTGVSARRLVVDETGVRNVVVAADAFPIRKRSLPLADVPPVGFHALPNEDGSSTFLARRGDSIVALDGRCTHMGCPIAIAVDGAGFRCPCHAGTFDAEGRPTGGPPKRPLARVTVAVEGQTVVVGNDASGVSEEGIECDHCVVACEVRGLQRLMSASNLPFPDLSKRVASLGEADPYVVWRLWLDRPTAPDRKPFYTVSKMRFTDSVAIYSLFQEPYMSWAKRSGGSVLEVHAYAIWPRATSAEIRTVMMKELRQLFPELADARVRHEEFQEQDNFSRFAPGDHALRPSTETPIANLFLAGDHVRLPVAASLMEAATISGRLSANAILRKEGVREVPIWTVASHGPLVL